MCGKGTEGNIYIYIYIYNFIRHTYFDLFHLIDMCIINTHLYLDN